MKRIAMAAVSGALFGLGLAVSGMADADKVLNFLDIAGHWDPSLAVVMGAALAVAIPGFAIARQRDRSALGDPLPQPPGRDIDRRLLIGSALFGIGWGIAGYCPGPALANLSQHRDAWILVLAMLAGSQLARYLPPPVRRP